MKVKVNANHFSEFRTRITSEFPQWREQRLVQVVQNGHTVALNPLCGYQLSDSELSIIAEIEADFTEALPPVAEPTHGWKPERTPRRHYASQAEIVSKLSKMRMR